MLGGFGDPVRILGRKRLGTRKKQSTGTAYMEAIEPCELTNTPTVIDFHQNKKFMFVFWLRFRREHRQTDDNCFRGLRS